MMVIMIMMTAIVMMMLMMLMMRLMRMKMMRVVAPLEGTRPTYHMLIKVYTRAGCAP